MLPPYHARNVTGERCMNSWLDLGVADLALSASDCDGMQPVGFAHNRASAATGEVDAAVDQVLGPEPPATAMHLSFVTETYPPEINGVANTLAHLVAGMRARGHSVQVIRPSQRETDQEQHLARLDEVVVPGLAIPLYRDLRIGVAGRKAIKKALSEFRPDACYVATEGLLGWAALRAAHDLGIPVISGYHTNFDEYSQAYGLGLFKPWVEQYLKAFHAKCEMTLVPTNTLAEHLESLGYARIEVFSRGVDTTQFSPLRRSQALRVQWGADDQTRVISYVGRIAAEKNLGLLVDAYRAAQRIDKRIKLLLVGDGPEVTRLRKEHPDILFAGARRGEDLAVHYASSDLFVFPSLTETFGNVILEAMASGLPIVAFDYAAAKEHVQAGRNGCLVPLADSDGFIDAVCTLVRQSDGLGAMSEHSREIAAALTWTDLYARLETLFRRYSGSKRSRDR